MKTSYILVLVVLVTSGLAVAASGSDIIKASGVKGGLVVHLGCGDGKLTAELLAGESFIVHGLDDKEANVTKARGYVKSLGIYGKASIDKIAGEQLPYTDNFVNLLVSKQVGNISMDEITRVLVPGGVAIIGGEKTVKAWPEEIDEWPHFLYDAGNNPVASDEVVGPPESFQWVCEPAWSKHHEEYPPTVPMLVSSKGRIFYFEESSPAGVTNIKTKWYLTARDAFNGVLLWRSEVPEWYPQAWPAEMGGGLGGGTADYKRRLIAVGDKLYVTLGRFTDVLELDAASGKTIGKICDGAGRVELLHDGQRLFVIKGEGNTDLTILAFDADNAKKLWQNKGGHGTAISEGNMFFQDGEDIVALKASSGKELWRNTSGEEGKKSNKSKAPQSEPLRAGAGIVLVVQSRGTVTAYSAKSGDELWVHKNHARYTGTRYLDAYIIDGLVWVNDVPVDQADDRLAALTVGLDAMTGEIVKTVPSGPVWNTGHHKRCYPGKATDRFIIFSRRGAEFLELGTGKITLNNWTRGTCGYGVMPSNGLLYSPPHACRCYSESALRGLTALAAKRKITNQNIKPVGQLEKGPAYGKIANRKSNKANKNDWPTYRADASRSGSVDGVVAAGVTQQWQADIGGKLTQPVIADGKIFVCAVDQHTLHVLSSKTGEALWQFTAGARIDTPPTVHNGLALFGSADGYVYCLDGNDGGLVWRFRATPCDIRMGAWGQVESVWPVHGAVLVKGSIVYFAAGRSSFLDGGIYLYGLDIKTGSKQYSHHLVGPYTGAGFTAENPSRGFTEPGSLPDVLITDGENIYMRHMSFDPELKKAIDMVPNYYEAPERARENFGGDHKFWCDLLESGPRAFVGKPEWYFRSYFNNFPGVRLYSTVGLLDGTWHNRAYWSYGQVVGQQLVFNGDRGYAVRAYPNAARWLWYEPGQGYELYAGQTVSPKKQDTVFALKDQEHLWNTRVPFRPQAMVMTGDTLWLGGAPDETDPGDALESVLGNMGAKVWAVATKNGKTLAEYELRFQPVFDGMAAANGCLYISDIDGNVTCFSER